MIICNYSLKSIKLWLNILLIFQMITKLYSDNNKGTINKLNINSTNFIYIWFFKGSTICFYILKQQSTL